MNAREATTPLMRPFFRRRQISIAAQIHRVISWSAAFQHSMPGSLGWGLCLSQSRGGEGGGGSLNRTLARRQAAFAH
jgi:hypothetical protein